MLMNIHETISRLRSLKEDLGCLRIASQEKLRDYVTNRELPLEKRFQVWIDFCDKKYHDRLDAGDVSPIGDWVEADIDSGFYQRGADYDWDHFLDLVDEHHHEPECSQIRRACESVPCPTVDEFKEFLIAKNFGSMCYDW